MSGTKQTQGGARSLPEDIATEAGLPRVEDVARSLHDIDDRVGAQANARSSAAASRSNEVRDAAETNVREAAASVHDHASGAADDARGRAADAYDDVRSWASDSYEEHRGRAADFADRGYRRLRRGQSATQDFVSENPLLVGVVGLAAGLLLGALLPRTRQETEALGPWADEARDHGLRYARDVTQQGRAFVERVLDPDNIDAAVKRGAEAGEESYEGPERTAHRL